MRVCKAFLTGLALLLPYPALAEEGAALPPVTVPYYDYPPKMLVNNGKPVGPYIDEWERIAATAGTSVKWVLSSIAEETLILDQGQRPLCNTGRLVTPERLKAWIFLPYVFDRLAADVVVTNAALAPRIASHAHLKDLLADTGLHPTFVGGLAIGEGIEGSLTHRNHWRDLDVKSELQASRMVLANRADFTLINEDQFAEAVKVDPALAALRTVKLPGMYPRTPVSIACTKATGQPLLKALGAAMQQLGYETAADVPGQM